MNIPKDIIHIVLTGGPCGGKTTALAYLCQKLQEKGYIVIIVPEAATLCISGGLSPVSKLVGVATGQTSIITLTHFMEIVWQKAAAELAKKGKGRVVVLHDRGIPDSLGYCPENLYNSVLAKQGLNAVQVRDGKYDAVFHLVTAAIGAEAHYSLATNNARYENVADARAQDAKIIGVWAGHEHLRIIDNSTDFGVKLRRLYNEVLAVLGDPPIESERKFLVRFNEKDLPGHTQRVDIEQFYIMTPRPDVTFRLRKRGQNGWYTYYRTTKEPIGPGKNIELQDFVTEREYAFGLELRRPDTEVVKKLRNCFVYNAQYFELDQFEDRRALPSTADGLLEIELTADAKEPEFPKYLDIVEEVTGNPDYSNLAIAEALHAWAV